jgi:hypothetical protein
MEELLQEKKYHCKLVLGIKINCKPIAVLIK